MSRIIKFRAWAKNKKVMTFVGELSWLVAGIHFMDAGACHGFIDKDAELMQFIGLHDKNGKEIYEGDIVKRQEKIEVVEWIDGDDMDSQGYYIDQVFGKWEVIGNIYENPELLTKEQEARE